MMNFLKICAIPALGALVACAGVGAETVTRLAADPALTGGTYSTGGGITLASAYRNVGGRVALCGLWSESAAQTPFSRGKAARVLSSGAVYLRDKRLLTGLGFLRKVPATTMYSTTPAPCRASEEPWRPEYAKLTPDIRLPHQIVYRDGGAVKGPVVDFRQTGPGALGGSLDLIKAIFGNTVRIPLGQSPASGGGRYSSGGGIRAAAELRQIGANAYACGVWRESGGQSPRTEKQAPEVLARGSLVAGGRTVISDLRFFRRASSRRPLAGRQANCVDTGRPWASIGNPGEVSVRFPAFVVYPGPDRRITFVPTSGG